MMPAEEVEFTDRKRTISAEHFTRKLGDNGIFSIVRTGSQVWQHGSIDDLQRMNFPESVKAFGARFCMAIEDELEPLEALIGQRDPFITRGIQVRDKNKKIDLDYYDQYDQARSLLLDNIVKAVNAERRKRNPDSRGFVLRKTEPLVLDHQFIVPHDSFTIFDEDIKTPAMTLYLHNELASFRYKSPIGGHTQAFQAELAVQMRIHKKLVYQGMSFDGVVARVVCTRVTRLSDLLAKHKTDFEMATYTLSQHRNGFVADMVNLLQNHTDYRKVYTNHYLCRRWDYDKRRMVEA